MSRVTENPVLNFHVVDGDTINATLFLGNNVTRDAMNQRIIGIDAPEHKGRTLGAALKVESIVISWLHRTPFLKCITFEDVHDKWGRPLCDFFHEDKPLDLLSRFLLDNKLAHVYDGGTKSVFTDAELTQIVAAQVPTH